MIIRILLLMVMASVWVSAANAAILTTFEYRLQGFEQYVSSPDPFSNPLPVAIFPEGTLTLRLTFEGEAPTIPALPDLEIYLSDQLVAVSLELDLGPDAYIFTNNIGDLRPDPNFGGDKARVSLNNGIVGIDASFGALDGDIFGVPVSNVRITSGFGGRAQFASSDNDPLSEEVTSFIGIGGEARVVPLPPTAWLLVTALGFLPLARKFKRANSKTLCV